MTHLAPSAETDRGMWPIYAGVILIEIAVIAGLWFFSRHFGT